MTPPLIRFFLSLGILLLSGYNQLSANAYQARAGNPVKILHRLAASGIGTPENSNVWVGAIPSASGKITDKIVDETENDDEQDEVTAFRRYLDANYFIAFFYTQLPEYFCHNVNKQRLPIRRHFSHYASSSWYLILQVIRI